MKEGNLRKAIFAKPEGSQFGGVRIRRGPIFANSKRSQSGGVLYLLTQRGSNPEGSKFCQPGGVSILPVRKGISLLKDLGKQKKDYSERY